MPENDEEVNNIRIRLDELEKRVRRLEQTVYGNGQDGLVGRISRLEARIEGISKQLSTNTLLTAGTFLSIIVTLITLLVSH